MLDSSVNIKSEQENSIHLDAGWVNIFIFKNAFFYFFTLPYHEQD